jgi:hypothetical protein
MIKCIPNPASGVKSEFNFLRRHVLETPVGSILLALPIIPCRARVHNCWQLPARYRSVFKLEACC